MKPRNYVMALIAKNDPTRYHTRSVEAEHVKLQRNRARRRAKERKEICEISNWQGKSQQLHCGDVTQVVKGVGCDPAIHEFESRTSHKIIGVLPPPRTLTDSDRVIIIAEANAWNREFAKMAANIQL